MKKSIFLLFTFFSIIHSQNRIQIPYERHILPNGLNVILHEDHSTPTVSVNIWYHVGSAYEKVGHTGFAHLFEHLMFEGSGHVAEGDFDKLLETVGGDNNASTNRDRTNYFENIPSNALELALYLDSDRMGFLLDSMSAEKVDGQREVVKNERRQRYDNAPYGLAMENIYKNLYPEGYPYNWTTIGSMADLDAASHQDVAEFFRSYYVPYNASLVIAGDFNPNETLKLVKKWFGSIPAGKPVPPLNPESANLNEEKIITIEDNVQLPRLYIAWITPPFFDPGDAEMDILSSIFSQGKNSRLYNKLVYEMQITQDVTAFQASGKLSSEFMIIATARAGHNLQELKNVIQDEIDRIKSDPPAQRELDRSVNQYEASYLDDLEKPDRKADMLNLYFYYTGNPDYSNESLSRYKALSPDDIQAAALTYLRDNGRVILSVVPRGKTNMAVQTKTEGK